MGRDEGLKCRCALRLFPSNKKLELRFLEEAFFFKIVVFFFFSASLTAFEVFSNSQSSCLAERSVVQILSFKTFLFSAGS